MSCCSSSKADESFTKFLSLLRSSFLVRLLGIANYLQVILPSEIFPPAEIHFVTCISPVFHLYFSPVFHLYYTSISPVLYLFFTRFRPVFHTCITDVEDIDPCHEGLLDQVYDYDPDTSPYALPLPSPPAGHDVPACGRDYCRLGCVCDALAECDSKQVLNKKHCGNIDCVLECKCNYT